jgi:pimeloyl-[acyl-carrier protein] methyl ester esterase
MFPAVKIRVLGNGPDLVMIHGWGMSSSVWGGLTERLSNQFRLHLVDLPGHGEASRSPGSFEMRSLVNSLAEQLPCANWLGWSLGGQVALRFALDYPDKVDRLLLISTNPSFVKAPHWPDAQEPEVFKGFTRLLEQGVQIALNRLNRLQVAGSVNARETLRQLEQQLDKPPSLPALKSGLDILMQEDVTGRLAEFQMECLLMGGVEDRLVPARAIQKCAHLMPAATLQLIEGAGHAAFIGNEDTVSGLVRKFLQRSKAA